MKEKLKNIDFKHFLIVLLITLVIGFCVLAICLLNNYDENRSKTILNKYDDEITLNTDVLSVDAQFVSETEYIISSNYIYDSLYAFSSSDVLKDNISHNGQVNYKCESYNLNSIKLNFQNSNQYYLNIDNLYMVFSVYLETFTFYSSLYDYNCGVFVEFSNTSPDVSFVYNKSFYNDDYFSLADDNQGILLSYDIKLDFSYTYCNVYFLSYIDLSDEWICSYQNTSFYQGLDSSLIQNIIDSSNARYNALNEDYQQLENNYSTLNGQYASLDNNYQTLLEQYNVLLNQTDYSFSELFWSISAVPFGVLTSAFNINVLGVNLALNNYGFVYCYVVNLVI